MPRKNVVAVIQARLGSKRFHGKALEKLRGKPLVLHVCDRVKRVERVDRVVAAVPYGDHELIDVLRKGGMEHIVLGPQDDVLIRMWMAAAVNRADVVMRVTGDCPLWSPVAGALVLKSFLYDKQRRQYWSNDTRISGWPDGTDTEVFSFNLLKQTRYARSTQQSDDHEHVTTWMQRLEHGRCGVVTRPWDEVSKMKLSVDEPQDLKRVVEFGDEVIE